MICVFTFVLSSLSDQMYLTCQNPKYTHQCERASGYYTSDNKILSNVHKKEGVNNQYAKFECRGMKTVGVTDYTY